jgi:hypothetical protein
VAENAIVVGVAVVVAEGFMAMVGVEVEGSMTNDALIRASAICEELYMRMFFANMGGDFHSFIEWCGVLREHLNMVRESGANPSTLHTHSALGARVPPHQLVYMAEKLNCILAPFLRAATPDERKLFLEQLLEGL